MNYFADFHIHSHFSRATSGDLIPENVYYWAGMKGVSLVGTGDFTHPGWLEELKEKLAPVGEGVYRLKDKYVKRALSAADRSHPPVDPRFVLSAEISAIYKRDGKVRKTHHVVLAPDFRTVGKIQRKLTAAGVNITSDGRPILGMDSRDLLELLLECHKDIILIPAHIWTPWFSVLGAKSGFDSLEECFGDLTPHVPAVEMGLSTDPPMNWMCGILDRFVLTAGSDAHSPERLGRNATIMSGDVDYPNILKGLRDPAAHIYRGTISLFPQEGKYHYDGHRLCGVCWSPVESMKRRGICSVCGKPVTIGVMNRVARLADRDDPLERPNRAPFFSIIPLKELLGEISGVGAESRRVAAEYLDIVPKYGTELQVLLEISIEDLRRPAGGRLAEAIRRMRERRVRVREGFDGQYGVVSVFNKNERAATDGQEMLFRELAAQPAPEPEVRGLIPFDLAGGRELFKQALPDTETEETDRAEGGNREFIHKLNNEQLAAVCHEGEASLVIAGPGTGKTRVLTSRIAWLTRERDVSPDKILAITFTQKAASEIAERLKNLPELQNVKKLPFTSTFHAWGLSMLEEWCQSGHPLQAELGRTYPFFLLDEDDKRWLLKQIPGFPLRRAQRVIQQLSSLKQGIGNGTGEEKGDEEPEANTLSIQQLFGEYESLLKSCNAFDLDDLISLPVRIFTRFPRTLGEYRKRRPWILVDELQDINPVQFDLIRLLAPPERSTGLCVIGDPDQSIYGFRGSDVRFTREFSSFYPNAAVYRLKTSYRCPGTVLQASNGVIRGRTGYNADSGAPEGIREGVKLRLAHFPSDKSEAEFVARTIDALLGGIDYFSINSGVSDGESAADAAGLSGFAVLCRLRSQIPAVEKALRDHAIPFQTVGETPFFRREPAKTVIDVLKFLVKPDNPFLGERLRNNKNLERSLIGQPLDFLKGRIKIENPVAEALELITDTLFPGVSGEDSVLLKQFTAWCGELENGKTSCERLLYLLALGKPVDGWTPRQESVSVMTLHSAKGLEFDTVFITGCEEGLIPCSLYPGAPCDQAEERRLLYVGMTRAQNRLWLCHADQRMLAGRAVRLPRSHFLDDIERQWLESEALPDYRKNNTEPRQKKLFDFA